MYRCSVELSVRDDGQSRSESEHASLIDEHVVRLMNTLLKKTLPD